MYIFKPIMNIFFCFKHGGFKFHMKQVSEVQKKFMKACDVIHLLKTVQRSNLVAGSFLNTQQKMILNFQRHNLVEHNITDSSDSMGGFYSNVEENSEVLQQWLKEFTKRPLTRLDRVLLKGVYTNDKRELEFTNMTGREALVTPLTELPLP